MSDGDSQRLRARRDDFPHQGLRGRWKAVGWLDLHPRLGHHFAKLGAGVVYEHDQHDQDRYGHRGLRVLEHAERGVHQETNATRANDKDAILRLQSCPLLCVQDARQRLAQGEMYVRLPIDPQKVACVDVAEVAKSAI